MDAITITSSISKMIRTPSQWPGTCYKHRHAWKRAGTMIHQSSNHGSSFGYCKDFSRWPWPSTGSEVLFSRYSFAFSIPRIAGAVYKFPAEQGEWAKRRPPLLFLPRARVLQSRLLWSYIRHSTTLLFCPELPWNRPYVHPSPFLLKWNNVFGKLKKQSNLWTQYWLPLSVTHK